MDRQAIRERPTVGSAPESFCWLGDPVAHNNNDPLLTLCQPKALLAVADLFCDS